MNKIFIFVCISYYEYGERERKRERTGVMSNKKIGRRTNHVSIVLKTSDGRDRAKTLGDAGGGATGVEIRKRLNERCM